MSNSASTKILTLPLDSKERKEYPLLSGCLKYFPAAIAGVAKVSKSGNDKHNPGQELHHARGKSMDHGDCIVRHLMDTEDLIAAASRGESGATSDAILLEASQLVWRALAYSQALHETYGAPLAPSARLESVECTNKFETYSKNEHIKKLKEEISFYEKNPDYKKYVFALKQKLRELLNA